MSELPEEEVPIPRKLVRLDAANNYADAALRTRLETYVDKFKSLNARSVELRVEPGPYPLLHLAMICPDLSAGGALFKEISNDLGKEGYNFSGHSGIQNKANPMPLVQMYIPAIIINEVDPHTPLISSLYSSGKESFLDLKARLLGGEAQPKTSSPIRTIETGANVHRGSRKQPPRAQRN